MNQPQWAVYEVTQCALPYWITQPIYYLHLIYNSFQPLFFLILFMLLWLTLYTRQHALWSNVFINTIKFIHERIAPSSSDVIIRSNRKMGCNQNSKSSESLEYLINIESPKTSIKNRGPGWERQHEIWLRLFGMPDPCLMEDPGFFLCKMETERKICEMNQIKKLIYTQEVSFSHEEEWNVIWRKMDRSRDHYIKQNKSDLDIYHISSHSESRINIDKHIYIIL